MPNLIAFSTLNEKVQKYKVDYQLETAGRAFAWVALEAILGLTEDEILEALTDGSNDGGIDAIHIVDHEAHIFSFKYTEDFDHARNTFPENDVDKLNVTVRGIIERTLRNGDVNEALWDKAQEIWDLFRSGPVTFHFYLVSNKGKLVQRGREKFQQSLAEYDYDGRFIKYHYFDLEDLVLRILERKFSKVDGEVSFVDKQYFERSDGNLRGIVATISATDLIKLAQDPQDSQSLTEDAFNENIRVYLKLQNKINRSIYNTALSEENSEFWYLNNGVTIVCEECTYQPTRSPRVQLKNLQIVNGGQTTHALFEAYLQDSAKVDDVLVLARICVARNETISEKISETTNSQTPVHTRDLRANDRIQKELEEQFKALGYFYERKRNQYANEPKARRLDSELMGQIVMSYYLGQPSQAKNNKAEIFDTRYDQIFNPDTITANRILSAYRVYRPLEVQKIEIQNMKRLKKPISERDAFVSHATFHVLAAVRVIQDEERLAFETDQEIADAISKAIGYIQEIVRMEQERRGDLYTHAKFFKEAATSQMVLEHVRSKYPKPKAEVSDGLESIS